MGVDHFVIMNRHNSSSLDATLAPHVQAGIVELERYPFPEGSAFARIAKQEQLSLI